jgi:hypothetical protein
MNDATKSPILMVLIAAAAFTASASTAAASVPAPTSEEMARCAVIPARDTRLSCYDALAHRPPDAAPAAAKAPSPAPAPASAIPAAAPAPLPAPPAQAPTTVAAVAADPANFGLSATQTHIADLGPKSETAHISILSSDQTGQTFVVLDSGQTWTVLDPDGWLNTGDAVIIKRARLGSYLMRGPSNHTYRVHRLK